MIDPYQFDNANLDGDKEAVILPNPPTLINKLSANETNNIKDKLNEVIDTVNSNPAYPQIAGTIEIYQKGYLNGVPNQDPLNLERGDLGKVIFTDGLSFVGVWRYGADGQDWENGYEQLGGFEYEPVTD